MKLRFPLLKDADRMLSWMQNPKTKEIFANDFSSLSKTDVESFIENANKDKSDVNFVCVDDNDMYLGTVSLKHIDYKAKNAEYAVSFCYDAQGTGAAKYATEEILRYAFCELKLDRVYLNVIPENERANAFYKKMGFKYEGTFRKHILINGKLTDLCWYGMLKEEFNK